jgi:UDP-2-acetamido-3-amino-2,3-dideoxy-glucuronate N-acetyltransferase
MGVCPHSSGGQDREKRQFCDHTFIENDVTIGDEVTIKSGVFFMGRIVLKDRVFVGPNVTFMNDLRPCSKAFPEAFLLTVVEEWASIGANATIVGGAGSVGTP